MGFMIKDCRLLSCAIVVKTVEPGDVFSSANHFGSTLTNRDRNCLMWISCPDKCYNHVKLIL